MPDHQARLRRIEEQLQAVGPIHPGRISRQYNVCGTPGCQCKDPQHPRRHGPYHYLSYTFDGQGRTVFVPQPHVAEMQRRTRAYVRWKGLQKQWVAANIALAKEQVLGTAGRRRPQPRTRRSPDETAAT